MMQYIYDENNENLALKSLIEFFSAIRNVLKKKDKVVIALSGGSSLDGFYLHIFQMQKFLEKEHWKKVVFCFADERLVSLDDTNSNYKQLKEKFLDGMIERKIIEEGQIISIDPESDVLSDYNSKVDEVDIVLLGSGPDGHVASIFAEHPSVEDDSQQFILVENSPKSPSKRISMSRKMIENCSYSFIFFMGESKMQAYENFNNENLSIEKCPAKIAKNVKTCFVVSNLG